MFVGVAEKTNARCLWNIAISKATGIDTVAPISCLISKIDPEALPLVPVRISRKKQIAAAADQHEEELKRDGVDGGCFDPVDLCDIDLHTDSVPVRGVSGVARCC